MRSEGTNESTEISVSAEGVNSRPQMRMHKVAESVERGVNN